VPIFSLSFIVDQYQRAITGSRDFVDVMETAPAITDRPQAKELDVSKGEVSFNDVSFSYDGEAPVLKSISFTIRSGKKLALVGESGEGKTTISNLLMRLYEPTSGTITIDGTDITAATQASLRKNIATVFQDPALFSGTIKENIAYGRPGASEEEIVQAAKAANADEFIAKLQNGYDSVVGERGIKLSGGQKQRIAIARAILKDAPILILDEATSSLDTRSEHLVQAALERLMSGRTTLIIAHRLSTIAHVDTIVTLKGGRVDETGSPAALAKTGGIYAQLLDLQAGTVARAEEKLKDFELKA
jgi:ATP-binding cassette subfamily B protein